MAYHIKKDGTPGVCHAKPGNCPLGGATEHFETIEQAQEFSDSKHEEKFGLMNNINTIKNEFEMKKVLSEIYMDPNEYDIYFKRVNGQLEVIMTEASEEEIFDSLSVNTENKLKPNQFILNPEYINADSDADEILEKLQDPSVKVEYVEVKDYNGMTINLPMYTVKEELFK